MSKFLLATLFANARRVDVCYCRYVVTQERTRDITHALAYRLAMRHGKRIQVLDGKKCLTVKLLFRNVVFTVIVSFYNVIEDTNVSF